MRRQTHERSVGLQLMISSGMLEGNLERRTIAMRMSSTQRRFIARRRGGLQLVCEWLKASRSGLQHPSNLWCVSETTNCSVRSWAWGLGNFTVKLTITGSVALNSTLCSYRHSPSDSYNQDRHFRFYIAWRSPACYLRSPCAHSASSAACRIPGPLHRGLRLGCCMFSSVLKHQQKRTGVPCVGFSGLGHAVFGPREVWSL